MRILTSLFLLLSLTAHAESFKKGMVDIGKGRQLFTEYREAKNGQPTLVFLNGLTWDTRNWQTLVSAVDKVSDGVGILLYDMVGQGQTLLSKAPVTYGISLRDQVRDLHDLIQSFNLTGPRIVVGLSYGGAIGIGLAAAFPNDFDQLVLMAPFLKRLSDQDVQLNATVANHRLLFPLDPRSEDELYDFYLRQLVYATYPLVEPGLLENPFKLEATFRMVQGSKNFVATDLVEKLGGQRVFVLGGENDPYVRDLELQGFWQKIRGGASYLRIKDTAHKIPELEPRLSAAWLSLIMNGDKRLNKGGTFEIDPTEKIARSGRTEISLEAP